MNRRVGSTLVEVLVAIFVMGIGLVALLTLFPIGALRMAQAIHDDKCAQAALNAHALSIVQDIRHDPLVMTDPSSGNADLFKNPYPKQPNGTVGLKDADPYAESYAILVDPIGYNSVPLGSATQDWVGGFTGILRRRPVGFVGGNLLNIRRSFILNDDINFDSTTNPGAPQQVANAIFRDARFSWSYLLRRPLTSDPTLVDASVIVFDNRPLSLTGKLTLSEYVYANSVFDPATNTITVDYTANVAPPIRSGNWILDATIVNNPYTGLPTQHAYFYRVVAVDDIAANQVRFEVQNPIRTFPNASSTSFSGTAIVIDGIAEVFERGAARIP